MTKRSRVVFSAIALFILLILSACFNLNSKELSLEGIQDFDLEKALEQSKVEGKPLLIYFTGFACVNCRYMDEKIISDNDVKEHLLSDYIFIPLDVDDKRMARKELWKESIFRDEIISRVGLLNSELQVELTQHGTQPYFAIIGEDSKMISGIGYAKPNDFLVFLENGETN